MPAIDEVGFMTLTFIVTGWTKERTALLRTRVAQGVEYSEIAKELGGVTRNACIGKAHRLGLFTGHKVAAKPVQRVQPAPKPKQTTPQKRAASIVHAKSIGPELVELPEPVLTESKPVTLLALESHHCRWPVADSLFCGAAKQDGSSYCAIHRKTGKAA